MYILIIILVNFLIGAVVLSLIDTKEQALFKWAKEYQLLYPIIVSLWFVILIIWIDDKLKNG